MNKHFGYVSYGKYRRPRRLTNLAIDEVSSVDVGAGRNVRVKLLKRDATPRATPISKVWDGVGTKPGYDRGFYYTKGPTTMPTLQEHISKSHAQAVQGEISFTKAALEQQQRAMEMFPLAKSVGEALNAYAQTTIGKRDVQNLKDLQFLKSQWDNRIGDGASVVLKHGDDGFPKIHLQEAEDRDAADGSHGEIEEPWDKRVKSLMDKHGMSYDQAVSHLHRMEKVAKGI
jgi:hypothetical protein